MLGRWADAAGARRVAPGGGAGLRGVLAQGTATVVLAALLCAALSVLVACRTAPRHDVRTGMLLPMGAPTLQVPPERQFLMPVPLEDDPPRYPAGVAVRGPVSVCVELVVAEDGAVDSAQPLYGAPGCPHDAADIDARFSAAALTAVRRWQFTAAAICTYPPGTPHNADCAGAGVTVTPVPVRLAFVFEFEEVGGRARVRPSRP